MKLYNKVISLILTLLMIISTIAVGAVSVSAAPPYYNVLVTDGVYKAIGYSDGTASLFEASVDEVDLIIPASINGYTVTSVDMSFESDKLQSLFVPGTVKSIGCNAFRNCKNLTEVTISDGVENIRAGAFDACTSLAEIILPDSIKLIDECAFRGCVSLNDIRLPDNKDLSVYSSAFNDTLWFIQQPDGLLYLDDILLGYKGVMPDNCKLDVSQGTKTIAKSAFDQDAAHIDMGYKDKLVSVNLPDSMRMIDENAFRGCTALAEINFPDSMEVIKSYAFEYCDSLRSVVIPKGVTDLRHVFSRSGLESVEIKSDLEFWSYAFYSCKNLAKVTLSDSLKMIDVFAFGDCTALESVNIPLSVKTIESGAFAGCTKLADIDAHSDILMVGSDSFRDTAWYNAQTDGFVFFENALIGYKGNAKQLTELVIPESTKVIAACAFQDYENITEITLPDGLVKIGGYAFSRCNIESVVIPESVEFIGYFAFFYCQNLSSVEFKGAPEIDSKVFMQCDNLKSVTIPASVDEIGEYAFGSKIGIYDTEIVQDFVIYGYPGSSGQRYAKEYGLKFVNIGEALQGDADYDGRVTVKDATLIQKYAADLCEMDDNTFKVADVNADSEVNVKDATMIQKYVAGLIDELA